MVYNNWKKHQGLIYIGQLFDKYFLSFISGVNSVIDSKFITFIYLLKLI